jgi:hypothetical protein
MPRPAPDDMLNSQDLSQPFETHQLSPMTGVAPAQLAFLRNSQSPAPVKFQSCSFRRHATRPVKVARIRLRLPTAESPSFFAKTKQGGKLWPTN